MTDEKAHVFTCEGERCVAIVNRPDGRAQKGVLIVVGGPQYRAGSHRQFTLLCRALALRGIAAMRFDYRGMGDSEGEGRTFANVLPDIKAAIDFFFVTVPELREVSLWGLCDAASAVLFYSYRDRRVSGLVLLNPWVRTDSGIAKAQLKHYYRSRIVDRTFWLKVLRGQFAVRESALSLAGVMRKALRGGAQSLDPDGTSEGVQTEDGDSSSPLPARMANALDRFEGKVLLVLSGKDLTAQEFNLVAHESENWRELLSASRVEILELPEADHTFSRRQWRDEVAEITANWVLS